MGKLVFLGSLTSFSDLVLPFVICEVSRERGIRSGFTVGDIYHIVTCAACLSEACIVYLGARMFECWKDAVLSTANEIFTGESHSQKNSKPQNGLVKNKE